MYGVVRMWNYWLWSSWWSDRLALQKFAEQVRAVAEQAMIGNMQISVGYVPITTEAEAGKNLAEK